MSRDFENLADSAVGLDLSEYFRTQSEADIEQALVVTARAVKISARVHKLLYTLMDANDYLRSELQKAEAERDRLRGQLDARLGV